MEQQNSPEPSVRDQIVSRGETACNADDRACGAGGLVCQIKLVTGIALIAFLLVGSALGLF